MRRDEIDHAKEMIKDMMDMVSNLYYDVLGSRDEFETDSDEWDKVDRAMDCIKDASDCLDNAITELC